MLKLRFFFSAGFDLRGEMSASLLASWDGRMPNVRMALDNRRYITRVAAAVPCAWLSPTPLSCPSFAYPLHLCSTRCFHKTSSSRAKSSTVRSASIHKTVVTFCAVPSFTTEVRSGHQFPGRLESHNSETPDPAYRHHTLSK